MTVRTDRRSRNVRPAPVAESQARDALRRLAEAEVEAARALATIDRCRSYVRSGYPSIHAWAAAEGCGPQQTNRLLALGKTLQHAPELGRQVKSGEVPPESAISIGMVLLEPELTLEAEQRKRWVAKAQHVHPRVLRDQAEQTVEDARQGQPTLPMRFMVTKAARDGFRRAKLLMSKGKPRQVSEGEVLHGLARFWLERHDPLQKPLPERRSGPTDNQPGRYVPRRVAAIVERRSGGRCEVCHERRAVHKIHFQVPHAKGGSREADNLADACSDCHVLVDARVFTFSHFDGAGKPRWRFHSGRLRAFESVQETAPEYAAATPFG